MYSEVRMKRLFREFAVALVLVRLSLSWFGCTDQVLGPFILGALLSLLFLMLMQSCSRDYTSTFWENLKYHSVAIAIAVTINWVIRITGSVS